MRPQDRKAAVLSQLNHYVAARHREGYAVESCNPGVAYRPAAGGADSGEGAMVRNLHYHVLLKKQLPEQ